MDAKVILSATDEQILKELQTSYGNHPESVALQMGIALRNNTRLAEAILVASRTGRILSWVIGIATAVSALVEVVKLFLGK